MDFCEECEEFMDQRTQIYIMRPVIQPSDEEMTICEYCRRDCDWDGWLDDEELEERDGATAIDQIMAS